MKRWYPISIGDNAEPASISINNINQQNIFKDFSKLMDAAKEEDYMRESLKDSKLSCLSEARENLLEVRKHRMRVVEHFLCDSCDKLIHKPSDGFVIQGNILTADPKTKGGLIGNNFPEPDENKMINADKIKESVLCKECFCRILQIQTKQLDKWDTQIKINKNWNYNR